MPFAPRRAPAPGRGCAAGRGVLTYQSRRQTEISRRPGAAAPTRRRISPANALVLPARDVGVDPIAPRLPIGAQADDVRLVAMLAGVLIQVRMAPRHGREVF